MTQVQTQMTNSGTSASGHTHTHTGLQTVVGGKRSSIAHEVQKWLHGPIPELIQWNTLKRFAARVCAIFINTDTGRFVSPTASDALTPKYLPDIGKGVTEDWRLSFTEGAENGPPSLDDIKFEDVSENLKMRMLN